MLIAAVYSKIQEISVSWQPDNGKINFAFKQSAQISLNFASSEHPNQYLRELQAL